MKLFLFACTAFLSLSAMASDIKYPVSAIPESLKKNANVVKRMEIKEFEMVNTKKAILHYKYALTILNENGDDDAAFSEYYDKFRHVESVAGSLYDASGKLVRKMKSKDVKDFSGVQNMNLMDDYRGKSFSFYDKDYPYTVEFEAEIKYDQTFTLPYWEPVEHFNFSVEQSAFIVKCPADYNIRFHNLNYKEPPVQSAEKNQKLFTWKIENFEAIEKEFASPLWQEMVPMVSLAPSAFEIDGYKGVMDSWQSFGKFMYDLKTGRDQLPNDVQQKALQLTANISDEREKIKILYQFLQQTTRYVSIQLGIGGWQPFEASYVAAKGYGDCKALSNYMYSLLKAAGIKSCYVLIKAGNNNYYLMDDFPSNQFNHATLCVPLAHDTMWLECTDQTAPAGYQGNFTGNRKALLVDENGGTIVHTLNYGLNDNTQTRKINATVKDDGSMHMFVNTRYRAIQQESVHSRISHLSSDKVKEALNDALGLPTYTINNFTYNKPKEALPEIDEQLDISVDHYATVSGKRIFVLPNVLNHSSIKLNSDDERKTDIEFPLEWKDVDTAELKIPDGYAPESIPQNIFLKSKFGLYKCTTKIEKNTISYERVFEQYAGRFAAKGFAEMAAFYNAVYKYDRSRVVLVKQEN